MQTLTTHNNRKSMGNHPLNIVYPKLSSGTLPVNSVDGLFGFDPQDLGLTISETILPGIHFAYYKRNFPETKTFRISNSEPYISLVFSLRNKSTYRTAGDEAAIARFSHRQHNLLFIPETDFLVETDADPAAEQFVLNLSIERFSSMIPAEHPLFQAFRNMVGQHQPAVLYEANMVIRPAMQSILFDILHCAKKGYYKSLYLRSRVIELVMLQLEQSELDPVTAPGGETPELKRMYEVRELITSNLATHVSIIELAKKVGTNDCYLKRQFKEVFGTTVYGYLHKERMEKARQLLGESNRKISEVAKSIGYKHASHFSLAFKKYFGYLPNKIRLLTAALLCEPELLLFSEWAM